MLLLVLAGRDIPDWKALAARGTADEESPGLPLAAGGFLVEEFEPDPDILAVVAALAQAGFLDEAQEIANGLDEPGNRARALAGISAPFAAHEPQCAARIIAQAENAVRLIDRSGYGPGVGGEKAKRACALADMAVSLAGHDLQRTAPPRGGS